MARKRSKRIKGVTAKKSVVAKETSLNIGILPNEILEKIFEKLIELEKDDDSTQTSELTRNNHSYLNCRLVNSHWKFWMESVLEKKSISIWKTKSAPISYTNMETEPPKLGCIFVLKPEDRSTPSEWAYLPPPLESREEKGNPFPSRSLKLTSDLNDSTHLPGSTKPRRGTQLMWLITVFSKFGHNLTSLILTSVTLSPLTFHGILGNTPNLKALNLFRVFFRVEPAIYFVLSTLPALQHFQHVRVFQVGIAHKKGDTSLVDTFDYGRYSQNQLYNWILSPFKEQLRTLDIFGRVFFATETATSFGNLERLFIYKVDDFGSLLPNQFLYPRLKSLFLMNVQLQVKNGDIMEWFQRHIEPLAKTLSELHLELRRKWTVKHPLFQLYPKLTHSQNKTTEVVFREMKMLAITFPKYPEECEVIKSLITRFPNLEALTFLDQDRKYQVPGTYAESVVDREKYVKVCPNLKKVIIRGPI